MPITDKVLESGIAPFVVRDVPQVENTASLDATLASFRATPSGSVLVVDSGTRALSGIITGSDLTKLGQKNQVQNAEELATHEIVAIRDSAQLWQLLKIMNGENALRRPLNSLPVVDADGKPVGVIKREQLVGRLAQFEKAVPS